MSVERWNMDNFDTESNDSYQADSLHSNSSSLSGLSLYGNEFAELRHLVNPSKYPTPYLDRSSTPKAELTYFPNEEINTLKVQLQKSIQLNEQYRDDLQNLEKQIELKCYDKIDKLLKSNIRLEGDLENANNQIERIIKNYKGKSEGLVAKEKLELEKKLHQCTSTNSSLQIQCLNLQHEKEELDLENKNLKISLEELLTDKEIKNASIRSLKEKISEQHIELQNCQTNNNVLLNKVSILNTKIEQSDKSRDWYKHELYQCQNNFQTSRGELLKYKNQLTSLHQKISGLNIELSKCKNEVDQVRLQALKEKEELFQKLESIDLNYNSSSLPLVVNSKALNDENALSNNVSFYELTIEDLKEELSRIKLNIQEREDEFEKLKQENCDLIAKCLVLQKSLQQNENSIELLENSKKELVRKLEFLTESEKEKTKTILQFRNKVTELEVELNTINEEKQNEQNTIAVIREQFLKFKANHEKVKNQVNLKNKEILQLQKEKQELFMSHNWTICELEKLKEKDFVIKNLNKDIVNLEAHITGQTQRIKDLEFQLLKADKTVSEKENLISEKVRELENHNMVILQYKELITDHENKYTVQKRKSKTLESEKSELGENFKIVKEELKNKDLLLNKAIKDSEQLKNDHLNALQNILLKNNKMLDHYKVLEENYNDQLMEKDTCIANLQDKFKKLENDCENYIRRITDDQKVEMLLNHKNVSHNNGAKNLEFRDDFFGFKVLENTFNLHLLPDNLEKVIINFFDNLNMKELESTVGIKLKYLDEKLQKLKASCEEKIEKLGNQCGTEKIKEFEILLQVKDRDMKDKQNKMNKNNRTLLRKVKEHMRGRNSAEKQLKYLQDLYNCLSDDLNTSKLSISSKEYQVQTLERLCENYKKEIEKLQKELNKNKICETCLDVNELKERLLILEEVQEINNHLKDRVKCNEDYVFQLTDRVKEQEIYSKSLEEKIKIISGNNEEYKGIVDDLEIKCSTKEILVQEVSEKLTEMEKICVIHYTTIEGLNEELQQTRGNIRCLSAEIKILSSDLQLKVEYIEELHCNKTALENEFGLKNTENENLISDLRSKLVSLQTEIKNLKNDKFFLQRLSSDLKLALESYVKNNENMQEQLHLLAVEKQSFNSLPTSIEKDISLSGKYDEKYINRLLEENNAPMKSLLTSDIQDCLSKLREEIFSLQDQIIKKNGQRRPGVGIFSSDSVVKV